VQSADLVLNSAICNHLLFIMPPISTPAIILHSFKYSESSKIVRLLTRELGVLSAIAKGASQPKSKFGARLQLLSEGVAELYVKPNRDLHTLAEFEVDNLRQELATDIRRYASASALTELVLRFAPSERNEEIYIRLVAYLDSLGVVPEDYLETISLSTLWGIVCALGFEPSVDECARDGRDVPEGSALFSIADGGLLCNACASDSGTGGTNTRLLSEDRVALEQLILGRVDELGPLPSRHAAAHRRLLVRFITRHVSEDRDLKALSFWEHLAWDATS
jgi:DNA repair protein RecO (recombination protein O)